MRNTLKTLFISAIVLIPLYTLAQTGDPSLDAVLRFIPARFWPYVIGLAGLLYWIVCPAIKAYVKVTPETPAVLRYLVKFSEWYTQDSHRPPPIQKPAALPAPASVDPAAKPNGFVGTAVLVALIAGMIATMPSTARGQIAPPPLADWTIKLGSITIVPSVSVTPLVVSLKEWTTSTGPNAGAGVDVLWPNGYGFSPHITGRETVAGTKPLASVFVVVPMIARYGIRPGIMYQFNPFKDGAAAPWKEGFMIGISGAANLTQLIGMQPK